MHSETPNGHLSDGDPVSAKDMAAALAAREFVYTDGATQRFDVTGATTYVDRGRSTHGEWSALGDGRFSSFWPPDYRANYDLHWIIQEGTVVGLRFREDQSGRNFDGLYSVAIATE